MGAKVLTLARHQLKITRSISAGAESALRDSPAQRAPLDSQIGRQLLDRAHSGEATTTGVYSSGAISAVTPPFRQSPTRLGFTRAMALLWLAGSALALRAGVHRDPRVGWRLPKCGCHVLGPCISLPLNGQQRQPKYLEGAGSPRRLAAEIRPVGRILTTPGAIAQLGERLLCKQEVTGSIPVGSISTCK